MGSNQPSQSAPESASIAFYRETLEVLLRSGVPFLVGGAYAFEHYTGIDRDTSDLDVFVRPSDRDAALAALSAAGFSATATFPHWLAKVRSGDDFIDVIHGAGNGIAEVDDEWFVHALPARVLAVDVRLTPVEEMIWSKAFVMERERYDGADVAHLLRARGKAMDWERLVRRFGDHWPVLLSHVVLFMYVYPDEPPVAPPTLVDRLLDRARASAHPDTARAARRFAGMRACLGTLLSRQQYLVDVERWGYRDGRLPPSGRLTAAEIAAWTAAIEGDG